jgi:uncharacterized protein YdiU (UPF0061 family)
MEELEAKYEELKKMYMEVEEKYLSLSEKYEQEKNQNNELIDNMLKVLENTKEISNNYLKLLKENEIFRQSQKHGVVIEFNEGDTEFIPLLGDVMRLQYYINLKSAKYTFSPDEMKKWFKEVEFIMEKDGEKKNRLLSEINEL